MSRSSRFHSVRSRHGVALLLSLVSLPSAVRAGVIASTNFTDGTAANSLPAVTWTPALQLSANVPATGNSVYTSASGVVEESGLGTNGAYLGSYVDQTLADSTAVGAYKWQFLKGLTGPDGSAGTPMGAAGTNYFHVAYGTSGSGAGFTFTPTLSTTYVGTYVDGTATDSTNPASYLWTLWSSIGTDGTGLRHVSGTYFHIAYGTSAAGAGFTQTPSASTTYVGTYVDGTPVDSGSAASYTWTLWSGLTATNGIPGVSTVNGQTYYLHLKHSQTAGASFTASTGETPAVYPAPGGAKSKAITLSADFSAVGASETLWTAAVNTPLLTVSNAESTLAKLNLSFDLSANRMSPVKVRVYSFTASGSTPTGFAEGKVLPVAVNALYRFSIDLSNMTQGSALGGSNFVPTGANGARVQFSFIMEGNSTDAGTWQRVASNYVVVDNLCYTAPSYYASPTGVAGNTGLTEASPKPLDDVMALAQPGDVICLNGGTYTSTSYVLPLGGVCGTPSRWITVRPTSYAFADTPILRTTYWGAMEVWADTSYLDIHGLTVQGYYDGDTGSDAIAKGLSVSAALSEAAKFNTYAGHETDPAYTVYSDHNLSTAQPYIAAVKDAYGNQYTAAITSKVPTNGASSTSKFNTNGITFNGSRVSTGPRSFATATAHDGVHHLRIADNIVYNNTGGGIVGSRADYLFIEGNVVYHNNKLSRYGGSGISSLTPMNFDGSTGYKTFILANTSSDNGGDVPWDHGPSTDATGRKTVTKNFSDGNGIILDTFTSNAYTGMTLVANNLVYDNGGSGIHALKADHIEIVNNTAYRNSKPNSAPATTVDLSQKSNTPHYGVAGAGPYATYADVRPSWMTATGGASLNYGQIFAQSSTNTDIRNNILWARAGNLLNIDPGAGTNVTYDYNLFGRDGGFTASDVDAPASNPTRALFTTNAASFVWNKLQYTSAATDIFSNTTNSALTTWLHLRTASPVSPAINTGNKFFSNAPREDRAGAARPLGTSIDLGAFEDL